MKIQYTFLLCLFLCTHSCLYALESEFPIKYSVSVPDGFKYVKTGTTDSEMGYFINSELNIKINADIGLMAGAFIVDRQDMQNDYTIVKVAGKSYPKLISATFVQAGLKNCGHMEVTVKNESEFLIVSKFFGSFQFIK